MFLAQVCICPACQHLVSVTAVKTVQAAIAPADIFHTPFFCLVGKIRVSQQTPCHAYKIKAALLQVLFAQYRVQPACRPYRDLDPSFLYRFHKGNRCPPAVTAPVIILWQIIRRRRIQNPVGLYQPSPVAVSFTTKI